MADHKLPLKKLRKILRKHGVSEDTSRGKGSHTLFEKTFDEGTFGFPLPTHDNTIIKDYVKAIRKKFRLTSEHGVSDSDFYGIK